MNKLCIVNYIYGEKYQTFIPLYILSLKESYPEYDIRLYIDNELMEEEKKAVEYLRTYYGGIFVIENYAKQTKLSKKATYIQQIQRSQRWLFFDEAFLDYEAIYIGDIDLLIFKEKKPLFEQHMLHCEHIDKVYSNIRRPGAKKMFNLKLIGRNFLKFGFKQSLRYYLKKQKEIFKLTGLHFVKPKEYYSKVNLVIGKFYEELNLLAEGKSTRYNLCSFNNEALLRDLVVDAGLGDCPLAKGKRYNVEENAQVDEFRPHHGIHLGIFRSDVIMEAEKDIISSNLYLSYYKQFKKIKSTVIYDKISGCFNDYLVKILEKMENFYSNL